MNTTPFTTRDTVATNAEELAQRLADDVANWLNIAIAQRNRATLVVSGGSTPQPFLTALSSKSLQWDCVTVTLADERWVPRVHRHSNERFIYETLMTGPASAAQLVGLWNPAQTPAAGWAECESTVAEIPRPFDVVVLGMGNDGHTASLFADGDGTTEAIAQGSGKLTWPTSSPSVDQARMSMTLDALLDSEQLLLHITGSSKRSVYQQARDASDSNYPIATIIASAGPRLKVYWSP